MNIRDAYIEFFKERDHAQIPSAPIVPENDFCHRLSYTDISVKKIKNILPELVKIFICGIF